MPMTKEKYDDFVKELDHLKKVRRKEVAEALEYAKSLDPELKAPNGNIEKKILRYFGPQILIGKGTDFFSKSLVP